MAAEGMEPGDCVLRSYTLVARFDQGYFSGSSIGYGVKEKFYFGPKYVMPIQALPSKVK